MACALRTTISFPTVRLSSRSPATRACAGRPVRSARMRSALVLRAKANMGEVEEEKEGLPESVQELPDYVEPENAIGWSGVRQLISMGMGTMAGDITEINLDDPARTVVMEAVDSFLSAHRGLDVTAGTVHVLLEANNLEDENGDVKKGQYFEDGWVDEGESGPGFFENLRNMMSGGK